MASTRTNDETAVEALSAAIHFGLGHGVHGPDRFHGDGDLAELMLDMLADRGYRLIPATQPAPAVEAALDYHALDHLIAKSFGREDRITLGDARLAEILMSELKAAGYAVKWDGPSPEHYPSAVRLDVQKALAAVPERQLAATRDVVQRMHYRNTGIWPTDREADEILDDLDAAAYRRASEGSEPK